MSNNKQSSVEFLTMQLIKNGIITNEDLKQAKAMHKEECVSYASDYARKMIQSNRIVTAEMIYNETFGGNDFKESSSIFFGFGHGKSTNEPNENDYINQPLKNKSETK